MASLDEAQFLLVGLLTGMIAYYSGVLSKAIGKLVRQGPERQLWRVQVVRWLRLTIWVLIIDNLLVIARVAFFVWGRTFRWLDGMVVLTFAIADLMLVAVFWFSYHHESVRSALGDER